MESKKDRNKELDKKREELGKDMKNLSYGYFLIVLAILVIYFLFMR